MRSARARDQRLAHASSSRFLLAGVWEAGHPGPSAVASACGAQLIRPPGRLGGEVVPRAVKAGGMTCTEIPLPRDFFRGNSSIEAKEPRPRGVDSLRTPYEVRLTSRVGPRPLLAISTGPKLSGFSEQPGAPRPRAPPDRGVVRGVPAAGSPFGPPLACWKPRVIILVSLANEWAVKGACTPAGDRESSPRCVSSVIWGSHGRMS